MGGRVRAMLVVVTAALLSTVPAAVGSETGDVAAESEPGLTKVSQLIGADLRISGPAATETEWDPAVAYSPTANLYLVVWADTRDRSRGADIVGQRVTANGVRLGSNFRISDLAATGYQTDPAVAYNPAANQFLVVWEDYRHCSPTDGTDIYGQRVRANGNLVGINFRVSDGGADDETNPAVAYNPTTNQYLVVWDDRREFFTRHIDVYGQRVRAYGSLASSSFRISDVAATSFQNDPAVACNTTTGQYLVVWEDYRDPLTRYGDIYGQRVRAYGTLADINFRIGDPAAVKPQSSPAVAYSPTTNQYFVVWDDWRNGSTPGSSIQGQRIRAGGGQVGGDFAISTAPAGEWAPSVAFNPTTNQYLVVWEDERNEPTRGLDIYGRLVTTQGALFGSDFRISGAARDQGTTAVASNSTTNQYLVLWEDKRNWPSRLTDIYGQRVAG